LYRFALLMVEQIGYLAVISGGSNLFFQHVDACCERRAMILTSDGQLDEVGLSV
jgi:hypothetical protein